MFDVLSIDAAMKREQDATRRARIADNMRDIEAALRKSPALKVGPPRLLDGAFRVVQFLVENKINGEVAEVLIRPRAAKILPLDDARPCDTEAEG